jgi:hypothetical protein
MMVLAMKCSYLLFGSEHVYAILKEIGKLTSRQGGALCETPFDISDVRGEKSLKWPSL